MSAIESEQTKNKRSVTALVHVEPYLNQITLPDTSEHGHADFLWQRATPIIVG